MSSNFDWEKIKENASGRTGDRNEIKNVALRNNGFDWDKIKANASERKIIPVQTVDSENIVNRAAHEAVSNQQSYEEQKQSLKEQKSAANKERFSAALSYLSDKLSGENTNVSERKYETAKRKYSDIKSDLDNLKKNKWNQTQTDNETALNENADLSELVKKAYESKLLIDSSDNAKQMNNTAGQNNFLADVLYPNANQSDKYHSNYQKYLGQIKELGYDADSLIDTYSRMQNKQTSQQIAENTAEFADKHPVLASGAYVAANAFQAPALEDTIKTGLEARISGDYKPIDTNAPSFFATNVRDTISGQVTGNVHQSITDKTNNETLADAAAFLYQTGLSMGDFASVAALPQPASLAIMGTSAAASTAKEATERGVSADKAALTAIAAGGAEIVFEKLSLENLSALKATGRSGVFNTVKDILKQSFTEGSEEVITDISNAITDQIINGDDSALQQQYQELINSGMNENDARKQTAASFGRQIGESFLGGAISGGVMGTGGVAVGNVKQNADYRRVGNEIKNTGIAQNVINEGLDAPIGSNTQRAAAQLQNKLNGINVDNNTKDVAASMLSSRQLGKLQLANQNTVAKENLVNAVSSDPDSKLLTKAMTNVAEGRKISRLEFEAIKNSDTAISAINSEYGTSFTKDNIKRNILDNVSIISSRTLYSPSNNNAPTAEQTRINIANKIRERQQQANDNKPTENAKTNIKYNIEATDLNGNAVTISDISTDNGKLFVTTDNNVTVPADNLNIVNDNQKNLLKFARHYATDTAKSFVAGFEYNSNQNVGDYAEGFNEIYTNAVSTKNVTKMTGKQAVEIGSAFGLSPEQSFLAYSAAQNSILKSDSKVDSQTVNTQNNGTQTAVHNTSAAYPLKNTIQKQKTDIAQQKKHKQANLETALKSNVKGAVTVGTPKTSMQKAEIELLDSFAKDKRLSVIVVDSVRDAVGQDANAVAYHGKIIVGLDTENGMLLPYAGHELFHILKQNKSSSATAKELQNFIIDTLKNDPSYNYDERFNKLQRSYNFDGTDAEITDNINEEMAANACFTVLSNEQTFNSLVKQNKSLAQRVKDFFADFINQIRDRLARLANKNAEYRALQNNLAAQEKIVNMMTAALNQYQKNNTTDNGSVKYALKPYTEKQIANWSNSKNIVIYKSKAQLQQFINDAKNHENLNQKMYFGIASNELVSEIKKVANIDVSGCNLTLRADNILKIFKSHGEVRGEQLRGQRAITDDDIIKLPDLLGDIASVDYAGEYVDESKKSTPFVNMKSNIDNSITIGAFKQGKYLDLRIHTMFAHKKKGNNATTADVQASALTSKTSHGKVSSNITLSQTDTDVNNNSMQDKPKYSLKDSDGDELSKQQQEYFKDSKVRDENGNLLVMYHQTNADFTVFNTDNQKAGKFDSEMPTGIFLKPTETDIGLAGKKQMQVYVNITNPIVFFNRANAVIFFEKNIIGYKDAQEEIVRIDREYRQKYDEAELRDDELYKKLFEDFKAKKISSEKFKKGVEDTETKHILDEWTKSSDNARLNAKLLIDSYFAESEYDGMIVESDVGSFGRKVKSYIAFNSNQIKNTDNLNPTNNEDIRFSLRENDTEVKRLLKENAFLQDANDLLRQELQLTEGHVLNQKQVSSVANKLVENHGAYSIDKDLLTERLSGLYNYIANAGRNLNENYIWSAANDIGKTIAKASSIRDTSFYDEYRALKKRLRETSITVPKAVRDEVSPYANMNKIKIRNNGDIELDSFYTELSRDYPELFDADIINEADQLSRLIEVYESIAPIYTDRISHSGYTMEEYSSIIAAEVFDRYFSVKEVHTFADKKQKELDLLKLHYTTAIEDMKKSYASRYKAREKELYERIKRTRKQGQERLVKQQAHFNEVSQNAKERKHRTIIKNKIANVKKDLSRRLLNPTETSYVPRSLVQSIANICDLINETEIKDPKNNDRSQNIINELQNLHYNYEQLKNEEDIDYASEYEQEMGTKISLLTKFLKESIGENNGDIVQISQLSLDNLEDIYHILRDIKNTLVDATQQIGLDEKISNHTRGIRIINQLNDTKGMAKAFIGRYEMETLNPIRAVRKITEYNDDAELYKMVNEINLGQRKADKFISDASKPFENLRKDKKAYKRFSEDLVETNITDKNGNKLQLTENEIVQLIMTVKRRQGKMHLMNGGFILPDRKLHAKGKYKDALSNGTIIKQVNPYTVMDMYDGLSDYAKEWYSASQYLFNEQGKNAINEVSMLLKHKKIAATENYIPLTVDTDYTSKEIEGLKIDSTIEGMGSLKSVAPKAKQPLVIGGLNTVIDKHINDVSRYYGLAIPIRNFNKVYSVQTSSYYDSDMDRISVRTALRDKWGSNGLKLMDNLISDLQTSRSSKGNTFVDEAFSKVQSGFVQATLAGNISVTIKQAASYPTALANLSGKSLAKGLPVFAYNSKQLENLFNEIDEHTGLHYKRRLGMSSQEIGDLTKENAVMSKLPTVINPMKWIQLMDVETTAALWIASKSEIENNYPNIKVNSEEYWQKVTSLYEDTIENTQPNYDVLHRPELQKTTNKLTKAIIMFKTQPLQNTGILYDSAFELRQKHQEYKQNANAENKQAFDSAKRKFKKAVISQFLAAVTFSAMSLLAAALKHTMYGYRDDNDEVTLSSVLAGLGDSMMSLFATLLAPVGGGELYEGIKSLGDKNANDFVSVPVVTTINDLWDDISDTVDTANGIVQGDKEPADMWSAVENLGYSVAGILGIPAKNLVKYTKGIIANVKDVVNGDIGKFESGVDRKPTQNVDRYGKYYIDGDSKKSKEILDEMIENKKAEYLADGEKQDEAVKKAKSSVRSSFSSYYKKQYQKAFLKKDGTKRREITRILSSTGLFVYDNNRTLANVISDWEKEAQEEENKKKK